jgi:hypothetical protein
MIKRLLPAAAGFLLATPLSAQDHQHRPGMTHPDTSAAPTLTRPGQAAFGALAEVVAVLTADSTTDWSKVNLEALRQHLIDMDDVTIRSGVKLEAIPGGARFTVTGSGRTVDAIRRMASAHASMVAAETTLRMSVVEIPGGARVSVTAADASDASAAARIRGLGFHGLLATGDHHGPHHLAIARGTAPAGHAHHE